MKIYIPFIFILVFSLACNQGAVTSDAYGNFEAEEFAVSPDLGGRLLFFVPKEGVSLDSGAIVAVVDTTQLHLKIKQIESTMSAIRKKLPDEASQVAVFDERLAKLGVEEIRAQNLVKANAAPQKQLDDVQAEIEIAKKKKRAAVLGLNVQTQGMLAETEPLQIQLQQTRDLLQKSWIINPVSGVVLTTYVQPTEMVQPGRPLYKIASLNPIILRAYVTGSQMPKLSLGQEVSVLTDVGNGALKSNTGIVSWISSEAEFTPKIIQTREERANQVYAVKILVPNDGSLKIGMPAEVNFGKGK